eukprot:254747-Amphidinium_carterae.1
MGGKWRVWACPHQHRSCVIRLTACACAQPPFLHVLAWRLSPSSAVGGKTACISCDDTVNGGITRGFGARASSACLQ